MEFSFHTESFQREWIKLAQYVETEFEKDVKPTHVNPYPALNQIILKFNLNNFEECIYCRNLPVLNLEKAIQKFFDKLKVNDDEISNIENRIVALIEILGIIFNFCQEYRFRHTEKNHSVENFVWLISSNHIFFSNQLFYHGINTLPFDLIKQKYEESNLDRVDEIKEKIDRCISNIEAWDNSFITKKDDVQKLEGKLENYKTTYDFVLLNKGFQQLYDQKKDELKERREGYAQFGATLVCIPIAIIVAIIVLIVIGQEAKLSSLWFMVFPITTLMILLFYFTRVGLQHVRSVQSQMMQLELRMALCQFIHNYADDSEKLHAKNKAGFEKFENIIFSPLVSSDDKIPTTFDGMEQLAKLVSEFRK